MDLKLEGLQEFIDDLEETSISEADKERALNKAVIPLHNNIVDNAPEKTGNLKKSFKKKVKGNTAIVTSDERYAFILEYGSSHTKKHMGYFTSAVEESEDAVLDILEEELFKGWD